MKFVACKVMTVVNMQIFERGDLIVRWRKDHKAKQYGLVLEEGDPKDPDKIRVRDLKRCRDSVWTGVNDENNNYGKCQFVTHLDDVLFDTQDGYGAPAVLEK